MKNLFHPNSQLMILLQKISDIFLVNLCFLICCIPVFTIGAAITATYAVYFKTPDDYGVCKLFFTEFRSNFKQSTIVWLIIMAIGLVFFLDFRLLDALGGNYSVVRYVLYIACLALLGTCCYVFPLIAQFRNTIPSMMKNALILSFSMLPKTLLMLAINALPCLVLIISTDLFARILMLWLLIGFSVSAKINTMILKDVFSEFAITDSSNSEASSV